MTNILGRIPTPLVKLMLIPLLGLGILAGATLAPEGTPVPQALATEEASASPANCIAVARNTFLVTGGNLWAAFTAARNIPGCSNTISGSICWISRQWWGGGARWIVSQITGGRYDRC